MRLLFAVPFLFICSCTFNAGVPLNYDDQIVFADMVLQRFSPEECAYNPSSIKFICEDGQAEVLNQDLIIVRQKIITYAGTGQKHPTDFMIKELFKCESMGNNVTFTCKAKLPSEIANNAGVKRIGGKENLHMYARK